MDGSITGYPPQRNSIMITLRIYSSLWMLARRGFPLPPSPRTNRIGWSTPEPEYPNTRTFADGHIGRGRSVCVQGSGAISMTSTGAPEQMITVNGKSWRDAETRSPSIRYALSRLVGPYTVLSVATRFQHPPSIGANRATNSP